MKKYELIFKFISGHEEQMPIDLRGNTIDEVLKKIPKEFVGDWAVWNNRLLNLTNIEYMEIVEIDN